MARLPVDAGPILLLGVGGQTGFELRRCLAPLGPVVSFGRCDADLADGAALARLIRDLHPSLIVNAAAYNAVDKAEEEERLAHAINGEAPGILAEEARRIGAAFVHYSTDYVFGGEVYRDDDGEPRPYQEDDPPAPLSAYGRSKLAGEQAVRAAGGSNLVLRTSWVYSRSGRTFLAALLRLETSADEVRIVCDQLSCPTLARSLADATAQILAVTWAQGGGEALAAAGPLLHLAGSGWTSRYGFAEAAFEMLAAQGRHVPRLTAVPSSAFPTPAARPMFSALDTRRVRELLALCIPDWRVGLALCVDAPSPIAALDASRWRPY
jgi:dTDP-4-dehydrorhamnose reductase